jgi:hypothetical protein
MNDELKTIISQSNFEIIPGSFIYTKVGTIPSGTHFLISQDEDEITVVTKQEELQNLDLIERNKDNYTLIALNVSVPFYSVGFLALVSSAIADAGMNILIVSTYSKDYIMVREDKSDEGQAVLLKLGFNKK